MSAFTPHILPRGRITAALESAVAAHPLVVLTAPMGYGKTTSLRALMAGLAQPVFFLTVNQGAGSARYLWDVLCGQLMAAAAPRASLLQRRGFPEDNAAIDSILRDIRDAPGDDPTLLLIDDWHFAEFPEFDFFFERLVREQIPGLTLLLSSRTRPGLPLEDMRIKGLAQVFERDLLGFSETETVAYFGMQGIADAQAAKEAWKDCEGWPAGLWLKAQAHKAQGKGNVARDVEKLVESVILPQCGPEEQRLLVQLSLLDSFTPAQAVLVSGDKAAPRRLERLREHNALVHDDPASGGFRLHAMFRVFLSGLLDREAETFGIDKAALYRRTGESLLPEGDMVKAARFFSLAGRDEDLLRLLEIFTLPRGNLLLFFSAAEIVPMVLAVPWPLRLQRPLEYLTFIYYYFAECDPAAALPLLEEAEQRFAQEKSIPAALRRRLRGEALLIRGILAFNDLWAMCEVHMAAHALLSGRSAISSRHMIWNFACPHAASLYLRTPGTYAEMVALIEGNLYYFHDLSDGCSLGAEFLFRAEYLLERGEFTEVESTLQAAVLRAKSKEQITVMLAAAFCRARLYAATGREAEALPLLQEWIPQIHALGHVDLSTCLELSLGYLAACLGSPADIPQWLREGEFTPSHSIVQTAGFIQAAHGMALTLSDDHARRDAVARALPASLGPFDNLFARIHGKVQEALAAQHLYGVEKTLDALEMALDLARPDGIMLTIAEYGAQVLPLLRTLHKRNPKDTWLASLTRLTARYPRGQSRAAQPARRTRAENLTPREEEVLRWAAQGKSNAEIGARLGISTVTVKKLLSSAYLRLGVKNRAEAVRRFAEGR